MKNIITYTSYDGKFTSENPSDVKNYELKNINNPTIRRKVAEMASFFGIQTWFYKKDICCSMCMDSYLIHCCEDRILEAFRQQQNAKAEAASEASE